MLREKEVQGDGSPLSAATLLCGVIASNPWCFKQLSNNSKLVLNWPFLVLGKNDGRLQPSPSCLEAEEYIYRFLEKHHY